MPAASVAPALTRSTRLTTATRSDSDPLSSQWLPRERPSAMAPPRTSKRNGSPANVQAQWLPESAVKTILEYEARAEAARDEADAHFHIIQQASSITSTIEIRSADARVNVARLVVDGGSHLVLL
ncbi:uncharacterized protein LAESUDRAFT_764909 [Laetiporus sulphureus 93-53]|uniref:Uncharacterized protein n=1 Tax=Laetiporus sulphureus 93-53 TaxID=1314785 RepID=A0A165B220_9APHY|nr:uncharacterized protein LAESUDRAFT_764909 [Laetiporus sulphureus 93-53]KZT00081.1 hypothetical protein LAESUDRAFT_764909 [Laetiporus sulphureus 93-53]